MKSIKQNLVNSLCVLSVITVLVMVTNAQTAVSNHFLEVVDFKDSPVADAKVQMMDSGDREGHLTNEKGQLKNGLNIYYGDHNTHSFTISKKGYYTYIDNLGVIQSIRDHKSSKDMKIKIELLLIPTNGKERKAIGDEQSKREFFAAASKGDVVMVRKFLNDGLKANLTTSDLRGIPLPRNIPIIIYAARSGNVETINTLLLAGAKVSKKDKATRNILADYLESDPYHNELSRPEFHPDLHKKLLAFEKGAENLIKAGANADGKIDYEKANTMIVAARNGYEGIVKLLNKNGVSVNSKDENGKTVLMHVIDSSFESVSRKVKMAELLIGLGANMNAFAEFYIYQ